MEPLTLTDRAAEAIRARVEKGPKDAVALRLVVKATGCSGNSYQMEFAREVTDGDDRIEKGGAVLIVAKTQSWMLFGTVVDYGADDLGNEKFLFTNPNETGRCGCGESFQVKA